MEGEGRRAQFREIGGVWPVGHIEGGRMLILLSSSAQQRYADDIVRALAHPAGTSFQFRYDKKYVDAKLGERILLREPVLICYLSVDPAAKTARLIPCRFATVAKVEIVGSSWIFSLNAGSFVAALDDAAIRAALSHDERVMIPAFDVQGNGPTGKFALRVNAQLYRNSQYAPGVKAMAAFEETATALSADPRFAPGKGLSFFTVFSLKTTDRWWWKRQQGTAEIAPVNGRYPLWLGWRYWLELYSYSPAGGAPTANPTKLACESSDPAVRFTVSANHTLDSRYDLNRSHFTSTPTQMSVPAGLRISLKIPDPAKPSDIVDRCDITLEAGFRGAIGWTISRVGFIAVGAAAPAAIAAVKADQFTWPLFAMMVVGGAIGAIGTLFPTLRG
jgi:hypothetical protein